MTVSSGFVNAQEIDSGEAGSRFLRARPWVLLAFRCAVAVLFLLHPVESAGLLSGEAPTGMMLAISVVEIALIALVVLGLYARIAAFLLSGMMAFAFFVVHLPNGWNWLDNGGEPPALYCWVFLLLFVLGPGPISLDRRRARPSTA
jgi:putative oxidoreductase